MFPTEIKLTGDGSHTLYNKSLGEHYHSTFGAITESKHIFIDNGIKTINKNRVSVFEAGYGTGLNAYLTLLWSAENKIKVDYTAIELYPPEKETTDILNYHEQLGDNENMLRLLNYAEWGNRTMITQDFFIKKINGDIAGDFKTEKADIIYYDAFSPAVEPELWTTEIFSRLQKMLNPRGILVSYCVKGIVKQALRDAGFKVKVLPGPPGKRHMLYAIKRD